MTDPDQGHDDGSADTSGAVVGWQEGDGPPEHDPECGCGRCPEGSW